MEPTAVTKNLVCWSDDDTLTIKVIDDKKGYWAETKLTAAEVQSLNGLFKQFGSYLPTDALPAVFGKNLIVDRDAGFMPMIRITDYKRNYWAETSFRPMREMVERFVTVLDKFLEKIK
jgi:uncharacterized protein YraI